MKVTYLAAIMLALAGRSAVAETSVETHYSTTFKQCMSDVEHGSDDTASILACQDAEIAVQEGRINQAYIMIMTRLPSPQKTQLRREERGWIVRRNAKCGSMASQYAGGSLEGQVWRSCYLDETVKRRIYLERY